MAKTKPTQENIQAARAGRTKNFFGEMAKLYAENGGTGTGMQSIEEIQSDWQPRPQYHENSEGIRIQAPGLLEQTFDYVDGVGPKPEEMPQDIYDKIAGAHEDAQAADDMFEKFEKYAPEEPKVGYAKVTAGERPRYYADWETEGMSDEELKQIGAHQSQQRTLAPMDVDAKTVSKPGGMMDEERAAELYEAAEAIRRQWEARSWARGQDGEAPQPDLPPDDEPIHEPPDTGDMPQEMRDDFANYQREFIYGEGNDLETAASGDLDLRLNRQEESGTESSSEHPDWRDTGWTMHEVVGNDMTRYFLENPDTSEVLNVTGHPDASRE